MSTHPSRCVSRRTAPPSLFRFFAEWSRPRAPRGRLPIRPRLENLEDRTVPTTLHVTTLADDGTAGTLRSIINTANTNTDTSNTIVFDVTGTIDLTTPSSPPPLNPTTGTIPGPTAFDILKPLTITGSGQTITRDSTGAKFRFFFVRPNESLTLSNITLSNGLAQGGDGAVGGGGAAGLGGAIYNIGTLNVQGVTFTGNAAVGGVGGAASNTNTLGGGGGLGGPGYGGGNGGEPNGGSDATTAGFGGGGAASYGGGAGGGSGGFGGGGGPGLLGTAGGPGGFGGGGGGGTSDVGGVSAFGGGQGGQYGGGSAFGGGGGGGGLGGAIFSQQGNVTITNSTLYGNSVTGGSGGAAGAGATAGNGGSGFGGAVFTAGGILTITNSTLSGNTVTAGAAGGSGVTGVSDTQAPAPAAAGIAAGRDVSITANKGNTSAVINNSILGQSTDLGSDFFAASYGIQQVVSATSSGVNDLIRDPGAGINAFGSPSINADPMLDPNGLQDNGGFTQTIALEPSSPAIDQGSDVAATAAGITTDQRGFPRPDVVATNVDIGAFEVQTPQTATITGIVTTTGISAGTDTAFENTTFTAAITGSGFQEGAKVTYDRTTLTPDSVTPTLVTFTVPAAVSLAHDESDGAQGLINVTVINPGQAQSNAVQLNVLEELLPDGTRGTANQRFLSEVYRDLFHRAIDASGLAHWGAMLNSGVSQFNVVMAIENDPLHEFVRVEVNDAYQQYLKRDADSVGMSNGLNFLLAGGTVEQLDAIIVTSPTMEYQNEAAARGGFRQALYEDALGRDPSGPDDPPAPSNLTTPQQIADAVFASVEYHGELAKAYYQRFLDRAFNDGDPPPDTRFPMGMSDGVQMADIIGDVKMEFFDKTAQ